MTGGAAQGGAPGAALPVASGADTARYLWEAARGRRGRLVAVLALFLAQALVSLAVPLLLGALVDTVAQALPGGTAPPGRVPPAFWAQAGALVALVLPAGILVWASSQALATTVEPIIARVREDFVEAALGLERSQVEAAGAGDVVTRASDDISEISESLPDPLPQLVGAVLTLGMVGAGLGAVDPRFLAAFALTLPAYALVLRWYLRTAPGVYAAQRSAESSRGQQILGTLSNLPTVTAHRLEHRQLSRIGAASWEAVRWAMRTRILDNRLLGRLTLISAAGLVLVLGLGIWLAMLGQASAGQVTAAALLFQRLVEPIEGLLLLLDQVQAGAASLKRVVGVILMPGREPAGQGAGKGAGTGAGVPGRAPARGRLLVEAEGLTFSYQPGRPVLTGVGLSLHAGRSVALVGATGSGKSTLAALVAGAHRPTEGAVRHHLPLERILTVTQETHVLAGSLRDNLTLASPLADDAALMAALERVGAADLVGSLPEGLDTAVGHGGHALSASQAQHLALARVVLADPELVILDEATAEASSTRTGVLERAAAEACRGRACLIIAHRLSQAMGADEILVLEEGRIVERGPHARLVAADGPYSGLWRAWSAGRSAAAPLPAPSSGGPRRLSASERSAGTGAEHRSGTGGAR